MALVKDLSKQVSLFFLALWVKLFELFESLYLIFFIYPFYPGFLKRDTQLFWAYFFCSPYKRAKDFALKRGEDPYSYGEVPLILLKRLLDKVGFGADEVFYELGSGRGRACFFVHQWIGCQVIGIEHNPTFVKEANKLVKKGEGIAFIQEDFCKSNYKDATFIHLYGCHLSDESIKELAAQIKKTAKKNPRILSVSYSLADYDNAFEVQAVFYANFVWGSTEVYLQTLKA